ncbi:hypothetical protein MKW98_031016 [Papaver atlanticum]|uniref:Transmembrane protein n=1 Tax=Papaver atlanticum TaxID=357466 RepID=A0AAD4S7K7_9MAGN|nr:hypothetical protein MKW98_031016 [Papaver atlanticum]
MASLSSPPPHIVTTHVSRLRLLKLGSWKVQNPRHGLTFPRMRLKHFPILSNKMSSWEPSPFPFSPKDEGRNFLKEPDNIFESMDVKDMLKSSLSDDEDVVEEKSQPSVQLQPLKWPMWLLGPSVVLVTGMIPTLWLPLSSVFLGANTASLLSLIGLDSIFNTGAILFLLMADACARPKNPTQMFNSQAPLSYKFWNILASIVGFLIPLLMYFASHKGLIQPQLSFISFSVLLGPYLLLLSIQTLTEMLTWHWKSPVWLVTPIVYEAYRVLQLMRGLRLGVDIGAPTWIMASMKGLVSWWILILCMQLMRVAWFAGFADQARQQT